MKFEAVASQLWDTGILHQCFGCHGCSCFAAGPTGDHTSFFFFF